MSDIFETTAQSYEEAAAELETATKHLRVTARHFRNQEVPRGCAHAWAATGHLKNVQGQLDTLATLHAAEAQAE